MTKTVSYQYDGLNLLIGEDNNVFGSIRYTYLDNRLIQAQSGSQTKQFDYTANRKTACNERSITYDAYGNILNRMGTALSWNERGLLKTAASYAYEYNGQGVC